MTCGIYQIKNLSNGKLYIGSSWDIEQRWCSHRSELKHQKHHSSHLQYAWEKYGSETFRFDILEECSREELMSREQHYIDLHKSYDRDLGYNTNPVANGHHENKFSSTDEFRSYIGMLVKKRYESEEERRKTGEATRLGQSHPQVKERLRKNSLRRWAREGERELQCKRMKEQCNTVEWKERWHQGYDQVYGTPEKKQEYAQVRLMTSPHRKQVLCIETKQVFNSIAEAAKILSVSVVTIRDNANGKRKSKRYNFQWVTNEQEAS